MNFSGVSLHSPEIGVLVPCWSKHPLTNVRAKIPYDCICLQNRKNDLILIMTPEKQDKTLELSKNWSVDSTPARNEVILKRTCFSKICKVRQNLQ